jgi:diacyltrehalose acyltransferase
MAHRRFRWLGVGLVATGCSGFLELSSMLNAAFAYGDNTALIMGDAFAPTPSQSYVTEVMDLFINPASPLFQGQPVFPGYTPVAQFTPETDYGQGLTQGVTDLNQGITQQLANGNNVVVFGYSESTAVATQEMINLDALPADQQPNPADLQFVLVEDLNNPNGGFFERFPSIPSLNFPATPADTPYTTDIYTIEYSGAADFPQYPLNIVADLNAAAGYVDLHPFLLPGYPTTFNTSELAGAVREPTSPGYHGATEYFLIPTQNLPLLDGLHGIPGVGPALADLIQPDLRVIVDMGYDRTGGADVPTVAGLAPSIDPSTLSAELALGAQQGWTAAEVDLGLLPQSDLPDAYPYLPDVSGLESGLLGSGVSASTDAPASSAQLGDLSAPLTFGTLLGDLNTYLPGVTSDLTALFGSGAAADLTSLLSADLLPSLTGLFANPLDFLSF